MKSVIYLMVFLILSFPVTVVSQGKSKTDIIVANAGNLEITVIGHGTLMFKFNEKVIHVDPWSRLTDYSNLPKADIILLTHHHGDHLDLKALSEIRTQNSTLVLTETCAKKVEGGIVMKNGDVRTAGGLQIEAIPAYNLVHMRSEGVPYHPKGVGNGYVVTIGDQRVYIAGDTENIPEMKTLEGIDIAFLPMNLPYTMSPEMVADAVKAFKPRILYPYHYGKTDTSKIVELLKDSRETEVRIR